MSVISLENKEDSARIRNMGIWVAVAAILLVISTAWHGVIHPGVGASASDSMANVAREASIWFVAHIFFAMASAIFATAALVVLSARSRLTSTFLGVGGWSLLAVQGILAAVLTTMEATVEADAAKAGDLSAFTTWLSLSRGFEIEALLFAAGLLALAVNEISSPRPMTPHWASGLAALGAILVVVAIVGASGLRIVALGPLFAGGALPMLWFTWMGVSMVTRSRAERLERAGPVDGSETPPQPQVGTKVV